MAYLPWIITILVLIGTFLSALCQRNSKAQYYIKNWFFFWWYMGTAALVIPIALFRPGDSINMGWWAFWVKYTFTAWMFGVSIKKQNAKELVEYDGPCVIVCNHQTAMDQVVILDVWPNSRSTIMAKKSLKYAGTMGLAGILAGLIFVDRGNTDKAKKQTTKECIEYVTEKKGKLWVYPEGTRTGNRQEDMLPFKKGAFHIAIDAQVPIIPVVMSGYKHKYSDKMKKFGKFDVTISVLPKISTEGLTADDVSSLSDRVRLAMLEAYYKTSPHVERPVAKDTEDKPETPEVKPGTPGDSQLGETNDTKESVKEIEIVSSKTCDSDQNKNIGSELYDQEQAKSENLDDIGANKQNEYNSELGQNEESLKIDENNDNEKSVDSPPIETKTSTECASDVSKPESLVDLSEPENTKDSLSTQKIENDDSPSSQASSDSFVFVNSSKLDDEGNSENIDPSEATCSTRGDVEKEESQSLSVEDVGQITTGQDMSTKPDLCAEEESKQNDPVQPNICAEETRQDDPVPNSE